MTGKIIIVLKGYPRLSETFIAQELLELEHHRFNIEIVSLRHPTEKKTHPIHNEISAPVTYLPEYLHHETIRVFRGWRRARNLSGYRRAVRIWLGDLKRDFTFNRVRRFGQALVLAAEMPANTSWIYSHFIHTPASVARYAHLMTGIPWSCSAHAKDIWTSPEWELAEKLDSASWTVTCTAFGHAHLRSIAKKAASVHLVHHGVDLSRFPRPRRRPSNVDGNDHERPVQLLSVGRAVEKKGLDTLLDGLAQLPAGLHWKWVHIGGGDLENELKKQAGQLGFGTRVTFLGKLSQEEVLSKYQASDIFVLPCRITATGDRDGLPNVLVEAASQALPCISTPISGITELLTHGETGLLVKPDDPQELAAAMEQLISNPALRRRLGTAAQRKVEDSLDHRKTITRLVTLFTEAGVPRHPERSTA